MARCDPKFISLVFIPFQLYSRWLDSQNYVESTRHWYAQLLYFPFSLLYLSWSHRSVQRWLMAPAPPECTEEQRGMEVRVLCYCYSLEPITFSIVPSNANTESNWAVE